MNDKSINKERSRLYLYVHELPKIQGWKKVSSKTAIKVLDSITKWQELKEVLSRKINYLHSVCFIRNGRF